LDPRKRRRAKRTRRAGWPAEYDRSIGSYHYDKRLPDGSAEHCVVKVFALEVARQMKSWPERHERRTRWFALQEAAEAVREPGLSAIILKLPTKCPVG
jgi:hypothetical protein